MNTQTITGTITAGYTLAAGYSEVDVAASGNITGVAGPNYTGNANGGPGGAGIYLGAYSSTRTVSNAGVITGGAGGYGYDGGFGGAGVCLKSAGVIFNSGTITGGAGGYGAHGGANAQGGAGVYVASGGNIYNEGAIVGGARGNGVALAVGGNIANGSAAGSTALISGYVAIYAGTGGSATVTNFGILQGTGGVAVQFNSASDRLIDEAGATFLGAVQGGGGTLELAVGTDGTLSGLGTAFTGFAAYVVDEGASWILAGGNSLAALRTLSNQGTLTVVGSLANAGAIIGAVTGEGVVLADGGSLRNATAAALISGNVGVYAEADSAATLINYGTIQGTGGVAVQFNAAGDRLIAEAGSDFIGAVQGGGGVLELCGGVETIGGLGAGATATGAEALMFGGFGSYVLDAGGSVTLTGANTLAANKTLINQGILTVAGYLINLGVVAGRGGITVAKTGNLSNGSTAVTTASISGYFDGVYFLTGSSGNLTNFGTIQGANLDGIALRSGGAVTNGGSSATGALISGAFAGIYSMSRSATVMNFGTITGASAEGIQLTAGGKVVNGSSTSTTATIAGFFDGVYTNGAAGSLTNYGSVTGATFAGVLLGAGGNVTNGSASATNAQITGGLVGIYSAYDKAKVANFGTITGINSAGVELIAGGSITNGGPANSKALITGYVGIYAPNAVTVTNFGTITGTNGVAVLFKSSGDRLVAEAGSTWIGAVQGGGGTLELAGGKGMITGIGATGVLSGAETMTFSGFGAYVIDKRASWTMTGGNTLAAGATLTVAGRLTIAGTLASAGTLAGVGKSKLTLSQADLIGGTLTSAAAVNVSGAGNILDGTKGTLTNRANVIVVDKAALILQGAVANIGTLTLAAKNHGASLTIAMAGATLSGGGSVILGGGPLNKITGATTGATLTNLDNTISGGGLIGAGVMTLVNAAAGVIEQTGTTALTFDTGAAVIANAGMIEATGAGGVTIVGAVSNTGMLDAVGGNLTVGGAVTGSGSAVINQGTLDFASAFTENVTFSGATGELELAQSQGYGGTITGFSTTGGTALDLRDIHFVNAGEATFSGNSTGGVLTVTDGVNTTTIHLAGDYTASTWTASSDGHDGVIIVDPTAKDAGAPHSASAFASAMAGIGASLLPASSVSDLGGNRTLPTLMAARV